MSNKQDIAKTVRKEIEESDRHPDAPEGTHWTQRNRARSAVYSVRFTQDEVARIEQIARRFDVPPSTLVRDWVLGALADESSSTIVDTIERLEADVRRLRQLVRR